MARSNHIATLARRASEGEYRCLPSLACVSGWCRCCRTIGTGRITTLALLVVGLLITAQAATAKNIHVSPAGNDTWTGRSSQPNANLRDGPVYIVIISQVVSRDGL